MNPFYGERRQARFTGLGAAARRARDGRGQIHTIALIIKKAGRDAAPPSFDNSAVNLLFEFVRDVVNPLEIGRRPLEKLLGAKEQFHFALRRLGRIARVN